VAQNAKTAPMAVSIDRLFISSPCLLLVLCET
jgi:hypothetical protein